MKRPRYTPEQIAFALRQAENGTPVVEVCHKMGIAEQTFYRWKKRYVGMGVVEVKGAEGPAQMRDHARYLQVAYGSSGRRACGVLTFGRSTCRYESMADEDQGPRGIEGELWIPAHPRAAEEGGLEGEPHGDILRLPQRALASPPYDQPGGVAVRCAAAQDRCCQALQEGGQSDSGHMEDVEGG